MCCFYPETDRSHFLTQRKRKERGREGRGYSGARRGALRRASDMDRLGCVRGWRAEAARNETDGRGKAGRAEGVGKAEISWEAGKLGKAEKAGEGEETRSSEKPVETARGACGGAWRRRSKVSGRGAGQTGQEETGDEKATEADATHDGDILFDVFSAKTNWPSGAQERSFFRVRKKK